MNSFFVWNQNPEIISFFSVSIRWYGLFFGLSFLIGTYFVKRVFISEGKNTEDIDYLLFYCIAGTIIGARLFHVIFYNPSFYFSNPLEIFKVWEGGLASHGGGLGILAGLYFFNKNRKDYSLLWLTDVLSIPVVFGGALIRIGNFFNSEILGNPTNLPWAVIFERVSDIPRHPSQLYESILYFITATLLLFLYKKRTNKYKRGFLTGIFLTTIFTGRFFLEFLKTKQEFYDTLVPLNTGQMLSIPMIIAGVVLIKRAVKQNQN